MCILLADRPAPAALRTVSGNGAFLETNARPEIGSRVILRHPEAGSIHGRVLAHRKDGIDLHFTQAPSAVTFALTAIASDMTSPVGAIRTVSPHPKASPCNP